MAVNIIMPIFHTLGIIHHLGICTYTRVGVDYSKTTDPAVLAIKQMSFRYLTTWNLVIQTIYFMVALLGEIQPLLPKKLRPNRATLLTVKGYIFTTFVFPLTLFVATVFWGIYSINREWVFPVACDLVLPWWLNHSMHTVILIPLTFEIVATNQRVPSFKAACTGLSLLTISYDILFFFTYFEKGRWMYGIFYALNWPERICFSVFGYLISVLVLRVGILLQSAKIRYNLNPEDVKSHKIL